MRTFGATSLSFDREARAQAKHRARFHRIISGTRWRIDRLKPKRRGERMSGARVQLSRPSDEEAIVVAGSVLSEVVARVTIAGELARQRKFSEAEGNIRAAMMLAPFDADVKNCFGWLRQLQGDDEGALTAYREALRLDRRLSAARRNLATRLVQLGRRDQSFEHFYEELRSAPDGVAWLERLTAEAMSARDLSRAGDYAAILAQLRWGSQWYPKSQASIELPVRPPDRFVTASKLLHDVEQFRYLQSKNVIGNEFTDVIVEYEKTIARLERDQIRGRFPLDPATEESIGRTFNRIVNIRETPRLERVFSDRWDPRIVEKQYVENPPGVIIIDDFLALPALESLRAFCLESTIWFGNRYANGRLGAFFRDGFNCPLLLQIAEQLRDKLPRVIGDRHPLRQLWGFKNGVHLPGDSTTHADFAAVNVNFWITPTESNLDPQGGGLVIYGIDAPAHWDFEMYNSRPDIIKPFLRQQNAQAVNIPYRQNRAIIFNSDLFHATAELNFKRGYEHRRINVTMLYGDRNDDVLHRNVGNTSQFSPSGPSGGWKSAAFNRFR